MSRVYLEASSIQERRVLAMSLKVSPRVGGLIPLRISWYCLRLISLPPALNDLFLSHVPVLPLESSQEIVRLFVASWKFTSGRLSVSNSFRRDIVKSLSRAHFVRIGARAAASMKAACAPNPVPGW